MGYDGLTLQQKMVQIRSEIPALVKRAYSEDVAYDFTKIDDIFRYLTPAMNNWKVNLEIEFEQATKKDDQGNSVYIQYLNACQMWLYEADLGIEWINAENPEDNYRVIIHAIGTHEVPEKAKGSAWTYCLKYYLLDKYCIDQGGEDPDMRAGGVPDGTYYGDSQENAYDAQSGYDEYQENYDKAPEREKENAEEKNAASQNAPAEESEVRKESGKTSGKANEKTGKNVERAADKRTEGQPPVSPHIQPENGTMVTLPESAKESSQKNNGMSIEEARNIVCTFGVYRNKRLGDLVDMGAEGIEALRYFAFDYRGRDKKYTEGAKRLLEMIQAA